MSKRSQYKPMGSVSHGTLRMEDLMPAFLDEAKAHRLTRAERKQVTAIAHAWAKANHDDADIDTNSDLDDVADIINNHTLPGFYFGAHPGDGSDFGYWLSEGFVEEFDGPKVADTSEIPAGYRGEVLQISDHGNVTLYVRGRNSLKEIWAVA